MPKKRSNYQLEMRYGITNNPNNVVTPSESDKKNNLWDHMNNGIV